MSRVVEAIVPARLGRRFRLLVASTWSTNLGDGIGIAAGPLLVAAQSTDPLLVAAAVGLQQLPWLLFGLYAGVLADRLDRRLLVVVVDTLRTAVLIGLAATIALDRVSIAVILGTCFLLGTAEAFADTTTSTLLPMIVDKADLGVGNARIMAGFITVNQLAGPPIGAALFAAGMACPFVAEAVAMLLGAVLVARIALPPHGRERVGRSHLRRDIAEGLRWLWHHAPVRTLALTIFAFNVTFGAAWSVLVLYATQRLGLGDVGYGLVTTVSAVGGLVGTSAYGWLERHFRLGDIMRVGLLVETFTHLGLALTTTPWVAMVIFFVFGAHAFVWGTTSTSVRQRAVPTELQGRVSSVYMIGVMGGMVLGSAVGGVVAQRWGLTGPFWFGFVGSAVLVALLWRVLPHIAHAGVDSPSTTPAGR